MIYLIQAIIRELVAPNHYLSCSKKLWIDGLEELRRRGEGWHESGAFLLGKNINGKRQVLRFVYYDDLDSVCLNSGIVVFSGEGYGPLWQLCRETGLSVVADIHTHQGLPIQSEADRKHPMVAVMGHIALIIPYFANKTFMPTEIGLYVYQGSHRWHQYSSKKANRFFYIGIWG